MLKLIFIMLSLICTCSSGSAMAAFKSASDGISPQAAYNPQPLENDIILPMPCGLSMTLRAVKIPSGALIQDKTFPMGVNNTGESGRELYERQFYGHIAAPFTIANVPESWHGAMKDQGAKSEGDTYYFIGKYEVSRAQWAAVMDAVDADGVENPASCPIATATGGNLPIASVSWFEVQNFINKYNAWLVKNHPDSIPSIKGTQNIAFLRLPTEEEWEYAARGGSKVPPEWWTDNDFFPLPDGKKINDYGVFIQGSALDAPLAIGSRNANPLGLFDTAGNVREMVDGFFRMSIADKRNGQMERRLHGAAGGMLAKGGGFRGEEAAVMPGARDEIPLYTAAGPGKPDDLGFRLVLAAINIPTSERLDALKKAEKISGESVADSAKVELGKADNPAEAVAALAAAAEGEMKKNLQQIHTMLIDRENADARENRKNAEQSFRSLLYQAETLRAFAMRYSAASRQADKIRDLMKKPLDEASRKKGEELLARAESDLAEYMKSLEMGANYLKNTLGILSARSSAEIDHLLAQTADEYGAEGIFYEHMRQNMKTMEEFLRQAREKGIQAISQKKILKEILPAQHYKLLPEGEL